MINLSKDELIELTALLTQYAVSLVRQSADTYNFDGVRLTDADEAKIEEDRDKFGPRIDELLAKAGLDEMEREENAIDASRLVDLLVVGATY